MRPLPASSRQRLRLSLSVLLLLAACSPPPPPPETLFHGGPIVTLDASRPNVESLLVRDGEIAVLGNLSEVRQAAGAHAQQIDLEGSALMPALADHHVHLLNLGMSLLNEREDQALFLDLAGLDLEQVEESVARRARESSPGTWILGQNWSQGSWGTQQLPDHTRLTRAAPSHPVFLTRVDGHAAWLNEAALRLAGIDRVTPDPPGGRILRSSGGEPQGVLLEGAVELVTPRLPKIQDPAIRKSFQLGAQALAERGVTRAQDAGFLQPPGVVSLLADFENWLAQLTRADRERPLPIDLDLMIPAPSPLAEKLVSGAPLERQLSPRIRITHIKLFCDGALGSRGAWLSHPYQDDPTTRGVARMTAGALRSWAGRALDAGLDVATHAIGDAAVKQVLDIYAELLGNRPGLDPRRLRIEHFSYAAQEDFGRAGRLGIILSVQPGFVVPDADGTAMEDHRVGRERATRVYAWNRAARQGALLVGGSDYFSQPLAPLLGVFSAAARSNIEGLPPGGWHPAERLTRLDSLLLFTHASQAGGVKIRGSLERRRPADLIILPIDPLQARPETLLAAPVRFTYRRGVRTHPPESD